jgi:hypothetical protein
VWIRHAMKHKVRFLHVSGLNRRPNLDSAAMFASQHLRRIRLQSLFLTLEVFGTFNSADCSVLEHLELEDCILCNIYKITSRSLKVLRITRCYIIHDLMICARNLTHLSILDPKCDGAIVTRDLSSLVTASLILTSKTFHVGTDPVVDGHCLLDGLLHATTLELHAPLHEVQIGSSFPVSVQVS